MKHIFFVCSLLLVQFCNAQNVGIGTSTPAHPLSFSNALGNKMSFYGGEGDHYGIGLQSGLFQMYSDAPEANISFGYGSSTSFKERMTIFNSGDFGMLVNGRLQLRNGTIPLNTGSAAGIWFARPDNSANLGFLGVQNNQNIGFFGGPAGWGFSYDAVNSRVGIGTSTPNAALGFGATLGRKITLYPGPFGNAGFGIYSNELRIHSDNSNADITFGHEATGNNFIERMRVKASGAVAFSGSTGSSGQVLTSNGNTTAPTWQSVKPPTLIHSFFQNGTVAIAPGNTADIPGLVYSFTLSSNAIIVVSADLDIFANACTFCNLPSATTNILVNQTLVRSSRTSMNPSQSGKEHISTQVNLGPGTYTIKITGSNSGISGSDNVYSGNGDSRYSNMMMVQFFYQ